jgi:hypothetical protein
MEITVQTYDPTPDDVSVTTYPYEGKPRAQVDIGGIILYGDPGMLAAVLGQAMRYVLGFGPDARLEIIGAHGNSPEPKRWGIPAWKLEVTGVTPGGVVSGRVLRLVDKAGETVGEIHADDDGPEVFENDQWRPARPGEVATAPFEDEGGPTDA